MKQLIKILLFLLAFILIGFKVVMPSDDLPESEKAVNKILGKIAVNLKEKYGMRPIATNVAMPRGIVKLLGLDFQIIGPLSKEELRKILVDSTQDFLSFVNIDKDVQTYLKNVPFKIKNIEISLFVIDSKGNGVDDPYIGIASISRNFLDYRYLVDSDMQPLKKEEEESYDEALKALQKRS